MSNDAAHPGLARASHTARSTEARAVGKGTCAARLEVGGVPEEIPAIGEVSAPAEIVLAVVHGPRLAALKVHDGVDLPAFQQLAKAFFPGKGVTGRESEAVPDVEVAAGVLGRRIIGVLREGSETAYGTVVQAMTVSVTGGEIQPVRQPLGQGGLQAVEVGISVVRLPVDKLQIGEFGAVGTDAVAVRIGSALIDAVHTS